MKKLLVLTSCLLVLAACFAPVPLARAEEVYYVVPEGQEIVFEFALLNEDNTVTVAPLVLPDGVTVQKVSEGTAKITVVYNGLTGKITKEDIQKMAVSASSAGKAIDIAVKVDDNYIYTFDSNGHREEHTVTADTHLAYLGTYVYNQVAYFAVKKEAENMVYYALCSHANEEEINAILHPTANIIEANEPQSAVASADKGSEFTWVRFILILGIVVPLITIVLMIIRPTAKRRRTHREIYDSDDDYDGIDEV